MREILSKIYNRLTDQKRKLNYTNIYSFCNKNKKKYYAISDQHVCEELRPNIWAIRNERELCTRIFPETYVAELDNATIIGENDLILCNNVVLDDMLTCEFAEHMNRKKGVITSVDTINNEIEIGYHYFRHLPISKGISLIGKFSNSYYHFLIDYLPKLYYFYQMEEYHNYPILIDARAYQNFEEIIDYFNKYDSRIICVSAGVAYKIKKLVVASNCTWYDRYVLEDYHKDAGHRFDNRALQFVRNHALKMVSNNDRIDKVYISRSKQPKERRRLLYEDKVEKMLNEAGFITAYPEELSFYEQVNLFSQVRVLFGVTGAAFTNILFMPEDAIIILATCMCENRGENLFPSLWHAVGRGKFFLLQGKPTKESEGKKDNLKKFELDLESLKCLLDSL